MLLTHTRARARARAHTHTHTHTPNKQTCLPFLQRQISALFSYGQQFCLVKLTSDSNANIPASGFQSPLLCHQTVTKVQSEDERGKERAVRGLKMNETKSSQRTKKMLKNTSQRSKKRESQSSQRTKKRERNCSQRTEE